MKIKCSKGYTLIETIISLGLIFTIVFAVSALALGYSRYQTNRLERSLVQENFRYVVSIISEEIQDRSWGDIMEPAANNSISFELYLLKRWINYNENFANVTRFHVEKVGSTESQVFRKVYNGVNMADWDNWRADIENKTSDEDEPISDKIKAVSHLLFTSSEGLVIFITGETANKTKVTYVSQVFPRN